MTERGREEKVNEDIGTQFKRSQKYLFVVWYSEEEEEGEEEKDEENTEEEEEASNLMNGLMMVMRALMYQLG